MTLTRLHSNRVTTLPGKSSKVLEFSKTIFQAWKVMENSQGHGKSWKNHGKSLLKKSGHPELMKLCWTDCFVTLKYL